MKEQRKTKEVALVPRKAYQRYVRYSRFMADYEQMKKESPEASDGALHTAIAAKHGMSVSAVYQALKNGTQGIWVQKVEEPSEG